MNQRPRIVDQGRVAAAAAGAPGGSRASSGPRAPSSPRAPGGPRGPREWVSAAEATKLLGVKRETLYAYASRGLVRSASGAGPRDRVYNRSDVDRLRARSRARAGHGAVAASALRWGEPVLETSVGTITPQGPAYRGQPAVELARQGASFESVCSLLWAAPAPAEADPATRRPNAIAEADPATRRPNAIAEVDPATRRPNAIAEADPAT
ncbi:MAG TPA: citrate synthase, partial [Polyangiaceae bacterium]|nr:citrate synthase [Polyangiaceae bacterium]